MYLTKEIKENQQKYFQHVFRMFKDHIFRKLLHNKPYGKKSHPFNKWKHQLIYKWDWIKPKGLTLPLTPVTINSQIIQLSSYHMSTFSEYGSLRIISGAIQATVPAKVILVLISFHSRLVPKSLIFTTSPRPIKTLQRIIHPSTLKCITFVLNTDITIAWS